MRSYGAPDSLPPRAWAGRQQRQVAVLSRYLCARPAGAAALYVPLRIGVLGMRLKRSLNCVRQPLNMEVTTSLTAIWRAGGVTDR